MSVLAHEVGHGYLGKNFPVIAAMLPAGPNQTKGEASAARQLMFHVANDPNGQDMANELLGLAKGSRMGPSGSAVSGQQMTRMIAMNEGFAQFIAGRIL